MSATPIEDYALIGDTHTAALVSRGGSIDWLCLPRFDSGACFAALLGEPRHGRWRIAPTGDHTSRHRYRDDTLVLETEHRTDSGVVTVVDCMPLRTTSADVVRQVRGGSGRVRMRSELTLRFDYGSIVPWLRTGDGRLYAVAGPDAVVVDGDVAHVHDGGDGGRGQRDGDDAVAEFTVAAGETVEFRLAWTPPGQRPPDPVNVAKAIDKATGWWRDWVSRCTYQGRYRNPVVRSLITLKALAYAPSGGIVAAPTTSLPERIGGVRNWDYRYCWIRDATFTLLALLQAGYTDEAVAWREWLLRAVAGRPDQMQIMYGVRGERRLTELEVDWLPGHADSTPVRIGNAAHGQYQLDVYGELMDALHQARSHGIPPEEDAWAVQRTLLGFLESRWREPDEGIWEMRGPRQQYTHSKVMAWVAADRAVKAVERFDLDGPADRWRRLRRDIFDEVCERGYDPHRNTFVQHYGTDRLDAALLLIAPVGFLPATDERVRGTVDAIEKDLISDGLVNRYQTGTGPDTMPPGEGSFLACTFWLADNYILQGRPQRGAALLDRLIGLANDVGLLSEEYDTEHDRLVGNFPQALSHLALIDTAVELADTHGPSRQRSDTGER